MTRKLRAKVQYFCGKCDGKLIDSYTKDAYECKGQTTSLRLLHSKQLISLSTNETQMSQVLVELLDLIMTSDSYSSQTPGNYMYEKQTFTFLSCKKGQKQDHFIILLKLK